MSINKMIKEVTDKEKLDYLNDLLINDKDFYAKFIKYFEVKDKITDACKISSLDKLVDEVFMLFDNYYLDPECYCGYDYYEEYDDAFIEDLFIELEKQIDNSVKKNDFYESVFVFVAICKAIDKEPSINDEYGLVYDYQDMLYDYLLYLINKFIKKNPDIKDEDKKRILVFLSQNLDVTKLKFFEDILNLLIDSKSMATFTLDYIECFYITIQLKIFNLLDNEELFIKSAKKFYMQDSRVAVMLLKKLKVKNEYSDFESISKQLFSTDPHYFIEEILDVIVYEKSQSFYLELLSFRAIKKSSLEDYILLKKYTTIDYLKSFYLNVKKKKIYFYIQILKFEKMYSTLLELAYEFKNEEYIDIIKIVKPIKSIYPIKSLEIIKYRCDKLMMSFGRNRKTYIQIVSLLKILLGQKEIESQLKSYTIKLYNHKPNLPALKDEFHKANLV